MDNLSNEGNTLDIFDIYDEVHYLDNTGPENLFPFYWSTDNTFTIDINYGNFLLSKKTEVLDKLISKIESKNLIIKELVLDTSKLLLDICNMRIDKLSFQFSSSFIFSAYSRTVNSFTAKLISIRKLLDFNTFKEEPKNDIYVGKPGNDALVNLMIGLGLAENFFTMDINKGNLLLEKKTRVADELTFILNKKADTIKYLTNKNEELLSILNLGMVSISISPKCYTNHTEGRLGILKSLKGRILTIRYHIGYISKEISNLLEDISYLGDIDNFGLKEGKIDNAEDLLNRLILICNLLLNI